MTLTAIKEFIYRLARIKGAQPDSYKVYMLNNEVRITGGDSLTVHSTSTGHIVNINFSSHYFTQLKIVGIIYESPDGYEIKDTP